MLPQRVLLLELTVAHMYLRTCAINSLQDFMFSKQCLRALKPSRMWHYVSGLVVLHGL